MKNSLIKKMGQGALKIGAPLLFGSLILINSGCGEDKISYNTHNIDGKTVIDGRESFLGKPLNAINCDLIILSNGKFCIYNSSINSFGIQGSNSSENKRYKLSNKTHEDSVVINGAQEKVDYYLSWIDSNGKAGRIKTGLDALK